MFNQREKDLQVEALKIALGVEGTNNELALEKLAEQILGGNQSLKLRLPNTPTKTRYDQPDEKQEDQGPQEY